MQEYLPALLPLVIGLSAFAVGLIFAVCERKARESRKHELGREQMQYEPRQTG